MHRQLPVLPIYLTVIVANALPVWGAATGRLLFFQVLYLYWFESLLLVFFDFVRIMTARGSYVSPSFFLFKRGVQAGDVVCASPASRLGLAFRVVFGRGSLLLFYLLFIVLFIGFGPRGGNQFGQVLETLVFRDVFFNTAILAFGINMLAELALVFFIGGQYRLYAPRSFAAIIDKRSILIHAMLVGSVFVHRFLFEGKPYEALAETFYVGIFMLIKTIGDLRHLRAGPIRPPLSPLSGTYRR